MFSVEIVRPDEFSKMKTYWEKLQNGKDMTPFQSWFWYEKINNQCLAIDSEKKNCFYAVAKKDSVPVMIAPIKLVRHGISYKGFGIQKGIYVFGTSTHTDYLSYIYDEFYPDAFEEIIRFIGNKYKLQNFFFEEISENTQLDKYLSERAESYNRAICVEILPEKDFETYKKSLSKSVRQNLRTAVNRAEKDGYELNIEICGNVSPDTAKRLYGIYQNRTESKNSISRNSVKDALITAYYQKYNEKMRYRLDKYNYLVEGMVSDNPANIIIIIKANNQPIGFCYGLKNSKKISVMVVSFDEAFSKYSPGMAGIFKFIEKSYEMHSPVTFDLTRGNERYKYNLGGTEHYLNYYKINL